jgi:membrane-bound lytic murein transglycosylase B
MKRIFMPRVLLRLIQAIICTSLLLPAWVGAVDTKRADVQEFIAELVSKNNLDRRYVQTVLDRSEVQDSILEAMSRPAEKVKPWHEYRAIFITPERIKAGVTFYSEHKETLTRIQKDTGVPPEMILGIIGVESYYGRITGKHRVVDALVTLGFEYPPRGKFFRSELSNAFLLADEENLELEELVGSYAGAMGPPQFIPSSYRHYAVDGDGDGQRDLINNWEDILASVANYFAAHKWQADKPVAEQATLTTDIQKVKFNEGLKPASTVGKLSEAGVFFQTELCNNATADIWQLEGASGTEYWVGFDNLYVITRYNRSIMYALAAWELGSSVVQEAN